MIEDDGPGLEKEQKNKVFTRGFRVDEQTPGSGLGLNIVKDIVEIYKGKIWHRVKLLIKVFPQKYS